MYSMFCKTFVIYLLLLISLFFYISPVCAICWILFVIHTTREINTGQFMIYVGTLYLLN